MNMVNPIWKHQWKHAILSAYLEDGARVYLIHSKRLDKTIAGINADGDVLILDEIWQTLNGVEILELMKITTKYGNPANILNRISPDELIGE